MSLLLQAHSLSFAYTDQPVLRAVGLSLAPGQVLALIGPNGSGKSTLIKALLGHLRATGSIQWEGRDVSAWSRRELARRLAYLPQSPTFEPQQTVADVLRLGRAPYWQAFGLESPRDVAVIGDTAALLGLGDLLGRRIDEISGGQRQRVFLARCLIQEPRAMLLDEPNTFLDLRHQVEMLRLLRQLASEKSMGILLASHDLNLAAAFADRLLLLQEGRVVAEGPAEKVLAPELLSAAYGIALERIERGAGKTPLVFPEL